MNALMIRLMESKKSNYRYKVCNKEERANDWRADGVGFEPTVRERTLVFKTSTLNRSVIHPLILLTNFNFYSNNYFIIFVINLH